MTEIPDLAANKTTGYIQQTPTKPSNTVNVTSAIKTANSITSYVESRSTSKETTAKSFTNTIVNKAKNAVNTVKNFVSNTISKIGGIFRR